MNLDAIILAELQRGGPPLWVSGRTYPKGATVRSLTNLQQYVRKVAGAGAADPSADAANWEPWSKTVDTTLAALGTSVANVKAVADALAVTLANVKGAVDTINATPRGIKSIQRGITRVTEGATFANVTIAAVNLSKSYLSLLTDYSNNASNTIESQASLSFVNATTIKVTAYYVVSGVGAVALPVSWEVIEEY